MYIKLDEYAQNVILAKFDPLTQVVLLAAEDGISPYNNPEDITMETSFTINIVNNDAPFDRWFKFPIETSLGTWYIKTHSKSLLADDMTLHKKNNFGGLALDAAEGRVVESVAVKNATLVDIEAFDRNENGPSINS